MSNDAAMIISFVSVIFGIYQGWIGIKRNQKTDDKKEASQLTTVIVKLENIGIGISELKTDFNNVKLEVREDRERIVKLEAQLLICQQYCKRLNIINNKTEEC